MHKQIDTSKINDEAQDVAIELSRVLHSTKEDAFIYMIHSAARCYRSGQRTNYMFHGEQKTGG